MVPIEKKILQGYGIHDFIICTDSGLSSEENRKFNNFSGRAFITTVSIKKMSAKDAEWCLSPTGWFMEGEDRTLKRQYDITKLEETDEEKRTWENDIRAFAAEHHIPLDTYLNIDKDALEKQFEGYTVEYTPQLKEGSEYT